MCPSGCACNPETSCPLRCVKWYVYVGHCPVSGRLCVKRTAVAARCAVITGLKSSIGSLVVLDGVRCCDGISLKNNKFLFGESPFYKRTPARQAFECFPLLVRWKTRLSCLFVLVAYRPCVLGERSNTHTGYKGARWGLGWWGGGGFFKV